MIEKTELETIKDELRSPGRMCALWPEQATRLLEIIEDWEHQNRQAIANLKALAEYDQMLIPSRHRLICTSLKEI